MRDALTSRRGIAILAVLVGAVLVGALLWALATGRGEPRTGSSGGTAGPGPSATGAGPAGAGPTASASRRPGASSPPGAGAGTGGAGAGAGAASGFLANLGAIDPALVADRDRALTAGRATCQDLAAGKPYDEVVAAAVARFRAPGVAVDNKKATLIVDAARNHLCPD
jgi:hypothetical protein